MKHQALYLAQSRQTIRTAFIAKSFAVALAAMVSITASTAALAAHGDNTETGILDTTHGGFTGKDPYFVAITPDGSAAYVTSQGAGSISVIDTNPHSPTFNTQTAVIDATHGGFTGFFAGIMAIAPNGKKAYVTAPPGVSVIDTDRTSPTFNTQTGVIANLGISAGVAFTPDGTKAYATYVTDTCSPGAGCESGVAVIDAIHDTATHTVANFKGASCLHVVFTPDGKTAYVTCNASPTVMIDVATDTQKPDTAGSLAQAANHIAVTPDGKTAYIAGRDGGIFPFDILTNSARPLVRDFTGTTSVYIAFTPDGKTAYVANRTSSTISVIDVASNRQIDTVHSFTGISPQGIAFTPHGTTAYVTNREASGPGGPINVGSNNISVIHVLDATSPPASKAPAANGAMLLMPFGR
jgi:YVTN family beta-propeller protein